MPPLVIVGLSNPGRELEGTRHNVGAEVVSELARRHGASKLRPIKGVPCLGTEVNIGDRRVLLAVPTTYMNDSGVAVAALVRRHKVTPAESLVVVHDELDLLPGAIQVKLGGGLAGHNGLRSIRDHLHSEDFARVRIGIGKPKVSGVDHVLARPSRSERQLLDLAVSVGSDAVESIAADSVNEAMNRFNTRAQRS
ncbi:MAG: aminoacyl-tRNA hydrolase [Acidimicrobiales bacterium]